MSPQTGTAIAAAIAALVLAILSYRSHPLWLYTCIGIFLVATAAAIYFQDQMDYEEYGNDQIFVGELKPGVEYSLDVPTVCYPQLPTSDAALLSLGRASAFWATVNDQTKSVLYLRGTRVIAFQKDAMKGILLSVHLMDGDGNDLVVITNNRFTINPNKVKRVLTPDGALGSKLSVYDTLDRQILNIDFRNPLNMYITGTFGAAGSFPFVIGDESISLGGTNQSAGCGTDQTLMLYVFQ